jgi:hypothetical protein
VSPLSCVKNHLAPGSAARSHCLSRRHTHGNAARACRSLRTAQIYLDGHRLKLMKDIEHIRDRFVCTHTPTPTPTPQRTSTSTPTHLHTHPPNRTHPRCQHTYIHQPMNSTHQLTLQHTLEHPCTHPVTHTRRTHGQDKFTPPPTHTHHTTALISPQQQPAAPMPLAEE